MSSKFIITIRQGDEMTSIDMRQIWESPPTEDSPTITRVEKDEGWIAARIDFPGNNIMIGGAEVNIPGDYVVINEDNLDILIVALCMYKMAITQPAGLADGFSVSPHNPT